MSRSAAMIAEVAPLPVPPDYRYPDDLEVVRLHDIADRPAWLDANCDQVDVLITHAGHGADAALLKRLSGLKLVAHFGAGLDLLDLEQLRQRGVALTCTPDLLTDDVADLALMLTLAALRRLVECDRFVRSGGWHDGPAPLGRAAAGRRVGVFGLGRIGSAFAARAVACGFTIGYHSRTPLPGCGYEYFPSLSGLADWCDVLVAAVPGGGDTIGAIDGAVLTALGPDGFLVNVARGSVIDEPALLDALERNLIAGAALDVFAREPHIDARFRALGNVTLTPHIGSLTHDTRAAMADHVFANIRRFKAGQALVDRCF